MPSGQRAGFQARNAIELSWRAGVALPQGAECIGMVTAFGVTAVECWESAEAHHLRIVAPALGCAFLASVPKASGGASAYGVLGRYPDGQLFWAQSVSFRPGSESGASGETLVLPFGMIVRRKDANRITVLLLKPPTGSQAVILDGIKVVFGRGADTVITGVRVTFRNGKYQCEAQLGADQLAHGIRWTLADTDAQVAGEGG